MVLSRTQTQEFEELINQAFKKESFVKVLIETISNPIRKIIQEEMKDIVKFYQDKISELEGDIKQLQRDNNKMKVELEERIDFIEQRHRRKNIRLYGVSEEKNESTEEIVVRTLSKQLNMDIPPNCIEECYRVGMKTSDNKRHILIKFVSQQMKYAVYKNKSKLKGTRVVVKEDLTPTRINYIKKLCEVHGNRNVWSSNGDIFYKSGGKVEKFNTSLEKL